jgi:hypothetical protein
VVLLLICHLVWALVEKPGRAWLIGLWPRRGEAAAAARRPAPRWGSLLSPGWAWLTLECLILLGAVVPIVCSSRQTKSFRESDWASISPSEPEARGACFGDSLALQGGRAIRARSGALQVQLAWQRLGAAPSGMYLRLTCLGRTGEVCSTFDRKLDGALSAGGAHCLQREALPDGATEDVVAVAVSIQGAGPLPVDRGRRAFGGCALVLPVARS